MHQLGWMSNYEKISEWVVRTIGKLSCIMEAEGARCGIVFISRDVVLIYILLMYQNSWIGLTVWCLGWVLSIHERWICIVIANQCFISQLILCFMSLRNIWTWIVTLLVITYRSNEIYIYNSKNMYLYQGTCVILSRYYCLSRAFLMDLESETGWRWIFKL